MSTKRCSARNKLKKVVMKPIKVENSVQPLCYRCDWRASYHETGDGPRCECKDKGAVSSCYMYRPVRPLTMTPIKGEKRPILTGALFGGRACSLGKDESLILRFRKAKQGLTPYYGEIVDGGHH